ncbi:MAG: long-chain fatty acid--CoA ligase [Actinobacteria bacterium]|nr:long-chain fatty acid--CoA ligase [Actinomycetota bacterium]
MVELICLDMTQGPHLVDAMKRAWDEGHAIFPIDQRLPAAAKRALIRAVQPTRIIEANGETTLPEGVPAEPGDAVVIATSGSSGLPKAVIHTHASLLASARATSQRLAATSDDVWLACLPVSHIGGLSVVTRSLLTGSRVIVQAKFTVEGYEDAVREGATLVSLVHTALSRVDASLYRTVLLGGSTAPESLPINVVTTYGMTETGSGVVYDRRPLDGVDIKIQDDDILVRGAMLMRGYRNAPSTIDADGWLHTGDIGRVSSDGQLQVAGRRGDLIISGGENVWPEPVERVLMTMKTVRDCAVVGLPDSEWGKRVVALLETDDAVEMPLESVRAVVKEHLPAYMAPREVRFGKVPRTASGKIQRHLIVEALSGSPHD